MTPKQVYLRSVRKQRFETQKMYEDMAYEVRKLFGFTPQEDPNELARLIEWDTPSRISQDTEP